jgi:hypothetical protein
MVLNEVHVPPHLLLISNVKAQGKGRKREMTGREITTGESESLRLQQEAKNRYETLYNKRRNFCMNLKR